MRFRFLIIILCLIPLSLSGQLYSISDHYSHNLLAVNPAFSGSREALNITIDHRNYWSGFEGSPTTTIFSADAPINNERIGLGLFVMNDKIGISKETIIAGNYAYRLNLGKGKLSFGLGLAMIVNNTSWNNLAAHDSDDDLLGENSSTGIMPDFSFGIYYSATKYYLGLSVPLFLSHEYVKKSDNYSIKNDFKEYNYFFSAGYVFDIDHDIKFFPSLLVKYHAGGAMQADISSQVILKDKIWLGALYRSKNTIVGLIKYHVNDQMSVACSYDFNIKKTGRYSNSYEIMLNYLFKYNVGVSGPREF